MPDMFVNLLKLPPLEPVLAEMKAQGVVIRRAQPFDMSQVIEWAVKEFSRTWGDELTVAYTRQPATLYLAIREGKLLGFGAYECTCRNFFGPTGVAKDLRGQGIGRALIRHMLGIAFDQYHLPEVRISVFGDNIPALLLYASSGFRPYAIEERRDPAGMRTALLQMMLARRELTE